MKDSKRTEVLERIKELEKKGLFHEEVEINPPTITLKPEDVDYLNKKWYHRLNTKLANQIAKNYIEKLIKKKKLIIKEVIGFEKINNEYVADLDKNNDINLQKYVDILLERREA